MSVCPTYAIEYETRVDASIGERMAGEWRRVVLHLVSADALSTEQQLLARCNDPNATHLFLSTDELKSPDDANAAILRSSFVVEPASGRPSARVLGELKLAYPKIDVHRIVVVDWYPTPPWWRVVGYFAASLLSLLFLAVGVVRHRG